MANLCVSSVFEQALLPASPHPQVSVKHEASPAAMAAAFAPKMSLEEKKRLQMLDEQAAAQRRAAAIAAEAARRRNGNGAPTPAAAVPLKPARSQVLLPARFFPDRFSVLPFQPDTLV